MAKVTEASPEDPLFSWRDSRGDIRPLVKKAAMERVNEILEREGWNSTFGHSFRIGGASYYLAQKVDPEIVRLAGRWKYLAYEAYIRGFEQVISRHMDHVQDRLLWLGERRRVATSRLYAGELGERLLFHVRPS